MIIELFKKYREIILYVFFGGCTTLINVLCYSFLYYSLNVDNVTSNVVAWIASVLFAFITNKLWVFDSKSLDIKTVARECVMFFGCRLATGLLDLLIMYIGVNVLSFSGIVVKILANIIVIILNYILSKLIIFIKK